MLIKIYIYIIYIFLICIIYIYIYIYIYNIIYITDRTWLQQRKKQISFLKENYFISCLINSNHLQFPSSIKKTLQELNLSSTLNPAIFLTVDCLEKARFNYTNKSKENLQIFLKNIRNSINVSSHVWPIVIAISVIVSMVILMSMKTQWYIAIILIGVLLVFSARGFSHITYHSFDINRYQ